MIRRLLAITVVATLLVAASSPAVVAQSDDEWQTGLYDQFASSAGAFNENIDNVSLGVAGGQLANHRVNLYVNDGGEQLVASFYMDGDNHITDVQRGAHDDATLRMTADRDTVESILASQTPAADFRTAVEDDRIVIRGERGNPVEQVKWAVINIIKPFVL
jgi:hypothetical protein